MGCNTWVLTECIHVSQKLQPHTKDLITGIMHTKTKLLASKSQNTPIWEVRVEKTASKRRQKGHKGTSTG